MAKSFYQRFFNYCDDGEFDKAINLMDKHFREPKYILWIAFYHKDWWGFKKVGGNNGFGVGWFRIRIRLFGKDIL